MNHRTVISLFAAFAITASVVHSCRKDEKQPTITSKLVGKWIKTRYATDDNANERIDDSEQRNVAPGVSSVLEFKSDNTGGEYNSAAPDLPFTWQINGEQSLMLLYSTGDTIVHKIALVNSKNLYLTYRSRIGLAEYFYDKQK